MSFSFDVKNELCSLNISKQCCLIHELQEIIKLSGQNRDKTVVISTENAAFARRVFFLLKSIFNYTPKIDVKKNSSLNHHRLYSVNIDSSDVLERVLNSKKIMELSDCCKRAILRGAFLSTGSITDPRKTYHLEILTSEKILAEELIELLNFFEIHAKMIIRKNNFVVYIKEIENLADFLNLIKAHSKALEIENIRILKEVRNNVNRVVNCETANLEKTINTSVRQIENIKYIKNTIGFDKLPKNLREIAVLRTKHSEASLKELGEMLSPALGKSGVNHRLKRLEQIAENIKNLKGE